MTTDTCPHCSSPLVEITMTGGAEPLVMRSCSNCDHRWWWRGERPVDLAGALRAVPRRAAALTARPT